MASADTEAAMKYSKTFKNIIRDKGYRPEQVFNMDETCLFWKKMPSRTYLMKDEAKAPGFKAQKDRVTLIMCGNAAGFMLKPGLIYKAANPRALKNKNKNFLPVFWMHNAKAWTTKVLMSNWFIQSFIPQVKEYLIDLCMEFKVLLIMDGAGGHPVDLYCEGVQLEFLPANTTSLLQPMGQGVIRAFKALYTQNSLEHLLREMDTSSEIMLKKCWHKFTIATCLGVIDRSLKDMKKETLNACWKKLWPECVHNYKGFSPEEIQHSAINKAVQLARTLGGEGFDDITEGEIGSLIDDNSDPVTDQDLEELKKSASEEEVIAGSGDEEDEGLHLERLSQLKTIIKKVQESALAWDPCMERSLKFINALDAAMAPYTDVIISMKKQQQQLPITMFLERMKKDPSKPPKTPEEMHLVDKAPEEGEEAPPEGM
ncbi:tigger transposable element-derived protein 1-like [Macrobrachium nipponense]|uniref:tigger transposable element-derived protein 1-like n=1 Tax=Macrobrachium nipponense TaxID=159736 RepID=UPI0030C7B6BD